ncbi:uncharacterized protein PG998_011285 [Apiospora kogelbergensis]|uniref:uncharacterized protein n=1 Tax=Apiospora kogelbergensis TaxID=1337665 RepID=UPI00312FCB37
MQESTSREGSRPRRSGSLLLSQMLDTVDGLSFVKNCEPIDHLPHFRLSLNADRKLEEEQLEESLALLPDELSRAQIAAREVPGDQVPKTHGPDGPGSSLDGASDYEPRGSAIGQTSSSNGGSTSGVSGAPTGEFDDPVHPHPGLHIEPGDDEYPPGPPSSPEHYSNRFFEIRKSSLAGYGAFASQDLGWGQKILVEPELFRADHVSLYDEFDKLTEGSQQAFERMTAHSKQSGFDKTTSIFRTNSFNVGEGQAAIYLVAARFNHACRPRNNVMYRFDHEKRRIILTTTKDVDAGTELTITYGSSREEFYAQWGFVCKCGGCVPLSDEEIARLTPGTDWN